MAAQTELKIHQIGGKEHVSVTTATKYLHISRGRMQDLISSGVIPVRIIGSRRFIKLEFLKAFTGN